MIFTLTSDNPRFSFVISKNPATILESGKPFSRELRKGKVYGWFPQARVDDGEIVGSQVFRLWFKDHPSESSFAGGVLENFEYLDKTRYSSPYLPIMMIQAALSTAQKSRQDLDGEYFTTAEWTMFAPDFRSLDSFVKHYAGQATVIVQNLYDKYVKVSLTAGSVFETLNMVIAMCVMQAMRDESVYIRLDESGLTKYLNALNNADSPYYPRYLFASRAINNRGTFEKLRSQIQGPGMTMFFGDTRQQRFDAISAEIKKLPTENSTLIDLGCGELWYSVKLAKSYGQIIAIDSDEDLASSGQRKVEHKKLENVTVVHADALNLPETDDLISSHEGCDVLITEVLEHIPEERADLLLRTLLTSSARRVIATVPNRNFNDNYGLGDDFRHPDHFYEPTFEEWSDYCYTLAAEFGVTADVRPIGDVVNDQSVTTMCVFTLPDLNDRAD